jgi:hypothetical protein
VQPLLISLINFFLSLLLVFFPFANFSAATLSAGAQAAIMATNDAKAHIREHGWVRIPGVLSKAEAATALESLWSAKEQSQKDGMPAHLDFLDPNASNVRVFYLMAYEKVFRDLIVHPTAVQMVKSVLGENFIISNFTANVARPGSESVGSTIEECSTAL